MMHPNTAEVLMKVLLVRVLLDQQFAETLDPRPRAPLIEEPPTDPFHDAARIKAAEDKRARKMAKRLKEKAQ